MTATRKQHSTKRKAVASSQAIKGVLYLAFRVGLERMEAGLRDGAG